MPYKYPRGKPLPIYGDGAQIRDWLHVEDHCRGIDLVLQGGTYGETYNIGSDNEWKNIDLVKLICNTVNENICQSSKLHSIFPSRPVQGRRLKIANYFCKNRPGHDTNTQLMLKDQVGTLLLLSFRRRS